MKVVLINDRLNAGGAEKVLVYIANLLYKNNIDVKVVLLLAKASLDDEINKAIPVYYLNRKSRFDIKAFKKLKSLVKDADIVHIHSRYNLRYYMVAKILMNINHPKIYFHEHVPSYKIDFFTKYLFSKVDAYIAVQDKMRQWAVETKMVRYEKAFHLANTVKPPVENSLHNIASKRIIMVSNFRPQKNHFFAIDIMQHLPPDITLDFCGMVDDQVYYQDVCKYINEKKLEDRIFIKHGITDIYATLSNYKLAIHTANAETGPLVLIEYIYAKLPFITFDTGEVVEQVRPLLKDFIINSRNINEWANRIQSFVSKTNWSVESENMNICIGNFFSEKIYADNLLKIYSSSN